MALIDCIKSHFSDKTISRCSERNCKLQLDDLSDYVLLKGEAFYSDRKMCDCIIFTIRGESIAIGLIELKSKKIDVEAVEKKLKNGLEAVSEILDVCDHKDLRYEFYPILLYKGIRPSTLRMIRPRKIPFKGRKYEIITKTCGISFYELMEIFRD